MVHNLLDLCNFSHYLDGGRVSKKKDEHYAHKNYLDEWNLFFIIWYAAHFLSPLHNPINVLARLEKILFAWSIV